MMIMFLNAIFFIELWMEKPDIFLKCSLNYRCRIFKVHSELTAGRQREEGRKS